MRKVLFGFLLAFFLVGTIIFPAAVFSQGTYQCSNNRSVCDTSGCDSGYTGECTFGTATGVRYCTGPLTPNSCIAIPESEDSVCGEHGQICCPSRPNCLEDLQCISYSGVRICVTDEEREDSIPLPDTQPSDSESVGDKNFHSLRPFPGEPKNTALEDEALFCGNDLIVRQSVQVYPRDASGRCTSNSDGSKTCPFQENYSTNVYVDLSEAELPFLGNTQDVPNRQSSEEGLSSAEKTNEYASWFLNGAFLTKDESLPPEIATILSFAGPLRKLLPLAVSLAAKEIVLETIPDLQHNQLVVCMDPTWRQRPCPGGGPVFRSLDFKNKIDDITGNVSRFFSFLPSSKTEDRVGEIEISSKGSSQQYGDIQVSNISFNPVNGSLQVFFPHTEETNTLARLLQQTFVSGQTDVDAKNIITQAYSNTSSTCNILDARSNEGDSLLAPNGNSLSGTLSYSAQFNCTFPPLDTRDQCMDDCLDDSQYLKRCTNACKISDDPEFCENQCYSRAEISCRLDECSPGLDEGCYTGCRSRADDRECTLECVSQLCSVEIPVALKVDTKTPLADDIWSRLVGGENSVFRRIFPKELADKAKDLPASTNVSYSSSTGETSGGSVEIYFPHLGGVSEYFLKGIQTALRPKGFGEPISFEGISPSFPSAGPGCPNPSAAPPLPAANEIGVMCQINCDQSVPDSAIPAKYLSLKSNAVAFADSVAGSLGGGKHFVSECYNDVVKRSLNAGVNPVFSLAVWIQESGGSNYTSPRTGCGTQDFGINNSSITSNFVAQIKRFLRLPYTYQQFGQCFPQGCTLDGFLTIYRSGASASCTPSSGDQRYLERTLTNIQRIAPGCTSLSYPSDMSCP